MNNSGVLAGSIALVTGAGRGIGQSIAVLFASAGASVAVVDINQRNATYVANTIGRDTLALSADIGDQAQVNDVVGQVVAHRGRIDILVNNAGIGHVKPFLDIGLSEWDQVIRTNLTGTFLCAQAVARSMVQQGSGVIINVGSISGQRGGYGRAAYGAAKAGVIQLTKVLSVELASRGVRVNCISPGPTETDQVRQCHDDRTREQYRRLLPLKRYADPSEVAAAALFLASPAASFISGHILNVDGGFDTAGLMPV